MNKNRDVKKNFCDKLHDKINHKKSQLLKSHMLIGNHKKGLNVLNTKLFAHKINKKSNIFLYSRDSFILDKKEIPGPGYYTKDIIKEKNKKNKNEINLYLKAIQCRI